MNKTIYHIFTTGLILSVVLMLAGYIYAAATGQELSASLYNYGLSVYQKGFYKP